MENGPAGMTTISPHWMQSLKLDRGLGAVWATASPLANRPAAASAAVKRFT